MAFGTFFKNIINGARKFFSAVSPYIRKAIDTAPVIGNAVGGKVGNAITNVANGASKLMGANGGSNGAGSGAAQGLAAGQWKLPTSGIRFGQAKLK